jgi:dTDP-4-dehydrorhamnose 3,5-epimerase
MRIVPTELTGVMILEPEVYRDNRGFFLETYHIDKYRAAGLIEPFVQDNHSQSVHGVLRGLHLQVARSQAKLIRTIEGAVFDVAVDV